jgi:hypothetical protein
MKVFVTVKIELPKLKKPLKTAKKLKQQAVNRVTRISIA